MYFRMIGFNNVKKASVSRERFLTLVIVVLTALLGAAAWISVICTGRYERSRIAELAASAEEFENGKMYYDALICYSELLKLKKNDYNVSCKVAAMYGKLGDYKNMLKALDEAEVTAPEEPLAYEMKAEYYCSEGKYPYAVEAVDAASKHGAESAVLSRIRDELFAAYTEKYVFFDSILEPSETTGTALRTFLYNGKYGIADKNGKKLVKPVYDWLGTLDPETGLIPCEKDGELFYIDKNGNRRMSVSSAYVSVGNFGNGYAPAQKKNSSGYIDRKGSEYCFIYDFAGSFSNGVAAVMKGKKWGLINSELLPVNGYPFDCIITDGYGCCASFGIVIVFSDDLYYFADLDGRIISDEGFSDVRLPASEAGMIAVKRQSGSGWSFADRKGKIVLETGCENAYSFSCGLAPVCCDGLWGYIDEQGNIRIEPQFSGASVFSCDGTAAVKNNTDWYLIQLCRFG